MSKVFENYIIGLQREYNVIYKSVNPRKTKLGDCRYPREKKGRITITVNNDLTYPQHIVTTLHEMAHAITFRTYGFSVTPHGKEWKSTFIKISKPLFDQHMFPEKLLEIIRDPLLSPKATSSGNEHLKSYEISKLGNNQKLVKQLSPMDRFELNGKQFEIIKKLRKHYLCQDLNSSRQYRVHCEAIVKSIA